MTPKSPNRTPAGIAHIPTANSRFLVSTLAAEGVSQATIARAIPPAGIAVNTLKKHYADELEEGRLILLVRAHRRLVAAIDDPNSGEAGTDAAIFIIERYGTK